MSYKKVRQELQCIVCRDLPTTPRVFNCCESIICGDCASRLFQQGDPRHCPNCRHGIQSLDGSLHKSRIIDNLIKTAVEETCKNTGCEAKICMEEKVSHKATCEFELITCVSEGCEHKAMRKGMDKHGRSCPYRPVKCRQCKAKVPRQDMSSHCRPLHQVRGEYYSAQSSAGASGLCLPRGDCGLRGRLRQAGEAQRHEGARGGGRDAAYSLPEQAEGARGGSAERGDERGDESHERAVQCS